MDQIEDSAIRDLRFYCMQRFFLENQSCIVGMKSNYATLQKLLWILILRAGKQNLRSECNKNLAHSNYRQCIKLGA